MVDDDVTDLNRRKVLRSISGSVAAGGLPAAMSSDSLAESTSPALSEAKVARAKRIVNEFSDTSTAQRAVKNHASGVIEGLQESDEVLADEAPVVTDFRPMTPPEFRKHDTGTLVQAVAGKNESISAEITYEKPISSGHLALILQPHFRKAYAVLRDEDAAVTFVHSSKEGGFTISRTNLASDQNAVYSTSSGCVVGSVCRYYPPPKTGSQSYIAAMITRTTAMTVIGVQN